MKGHLQLRLLILLLILLPVSKGLAFKPTRESGHVGIVSQALKPLAVHSPDGQRIYEFTDRATLEIRKATAAVDNLFGEFRLPLAHCDDELLSECSQRLINIKNRIISLLANADNDPQNNNGYRARQELGRALHTLQDFYSHSNWANMNGTAINQSLGRFVLGKLLPNDVTCEDEYILSSLGLSSLTTGYFRSYGTRSAPEGKCHHGLMVPPIVYHHGIHKDNPGRSNYAAAFRGAIRATQDYVMQILDHPSIRGNDTAIRALMDIRGTLGFVIDTTGSMENDIDDVKSAVRRIIEDIEAGEEVYANYLIVTFKDSVGTSTVSNTPVGVLTFLSSLQATGGDDCPERSVSGTISAIEKALPNGTLHIFTDASAKDSDRRKNAWAAAKKKDIVLISHNTGSCSPIDPAYVEMTRETGGDLYYHTGSLDHLYDVMRPTLSGNLQTIFSAVLNPSAQIIEGLENAWGDQNLFTGNRPEDYDTLRESLDNILVNLHNETFPLLIDETIAESFVSITFPPNSDFPLSQQIEVFGVDGQQILLDHTGFWYDLNNADYFNLVSPAPGQWSVRVNYEALDDQTLLRLSNDLTSRILDLTQGRRRPTKQDFTKALDEEGFAATINVRAPSTIDFVNFNFVELSGRPAHEGYFELNGEPVITETVQGIANIFGDFSTIDRLEARSLDGYLLSELALDKDSEEVAVDDILVNFTVPEDAFKIYAFGQDNSGNEFSRVYAQVYRGSQLEIELLEAGQEWIIGTPYHATFKITSHQVSETPYSLQVTTNLGHLEATLVEKLPDNTALYDLALDTSAYLPPENQQVVEISLVVEDEVADAETSHQNHIVFQRLIAEDSDHDGVADSMEQGPLADDPMYDGNHDGVADYLQSHVVSFYTAVDGQYLTFVTDEMTPFSRFRSLQSLPSLDDQTLAFPYGAFEFVLRLADEANGTAQVTLMGINQATDFYRFASSDLSAGDSFLFNEAVGATIGVDSLLLVLGDGETGDEDNINDNTIIVRGAPALLAEPLIELEPLPDELPNSAAGSGGGCQLFR